jgi:hypothetical protein
MFAIESNTFGTDVSARRAQFRHAIAIANPPSSKRGRRRR